jgi:putative ABC transport system permease protein
MTVPSGGERRAARWTVAAYDALAALYPRQLGSRFGADMRAFVRMRAGQARGIRLVGLWITLLFDLARTLPRAWLDALADRAHGQERTTLDTQEHWRRAAEDEIVDVLWRDVRFGMRSLGQRPAYTAVAILTLALGIGATTVLFSAVNGVLLRPLPFPDADRIVMLWATAGANTGDPLLASYPDVIDWRTRSHSFDRLGVMRSQSVNLTGRGTPDRIVGEFVGAEVFDVLGARTELGRLFTVSESTPGHGARVVVLSDGTWRTRFGGDAHIIGRTLTLNGQPHVVVGVLSPDFQDPLGAATDVWLPITSTPNALTFTRGVTNVWAVARLRTGVTVASAQRELHGIAAQLADEYPATNRGAGAYVVSLRDQVVGPMRAALLVVFAAAGLLLLIACATVANLQLARAVARRDEIAVRTALGAERHRIIRQLLTESLLLALAGGALGALIARPALSVLAALVPRGLPAFGPVTVSAPALAFALVASAASALVFGLVPAMTASRTDVRTALGSRASAGSEHRARGTASVSAAQLALCTVLLIVAALVTRSLTELRRVDTGFDGENVLGAELRMPAAAYAGDTARMLFLEGLLRQLHAIPGAQSAALVASVPLSGNWASGRYEVEGRADPAGQGPLAQTNAASDGYFATMRIPISAGRAFTAGDRLGSPRVAVVGRTLAAREWPGEPAVGKHIRMQGDTTWMTVVGVAGDVKQRTLADEPTAQLYTPMLQTPGIFTSILVRTAGGPAAAAAGALRAAVWAVDPNQPVWRIAPLAAMRADATRQQRFTAVLTASFALLALVLGTLGVYGVVSYAVARRTREIGLRLAFGASRGRVVVLVVRDAVRVALVAAAAGTLVAAAAVEALRTQLFGVAPHDPATFVAVPLVLVATAAVAAYLPARRAGRIEVMEALRLE